MSTHFRQFDVASFFAASERRLRQQTVGAKILKYLAALLFVLGPEVMKPLKIPNLRQWLLTPFLLRIGRSARRRPGRREVSNPSLPILPVNGDNRQWVPVNRC